MRTLLSLALSSFLLISTSSYAEDHKVVESLKIESLSMSSEELAEDSFESKVNSVIHDSSDDVRYIYPVLYNVRFDSKALNLPFMVAFGSEFNSRREVSDTIYDESGNRLLVYSLSLANSRADRELRVWLNLTVTSYPYSSPGVSEKILVMQQNFSVPINHDLTMEVTKKLDIEGADFSVGFKFPPEASISRKGLLY